MKVIDLSKSLKEYKSEWVAVTKKNKVVAHAKTFELICKKIKGRKDLLLIPASENYFGFVTTIYA
ncbi:MAG: hypothetical protein A3H79_00065 [Candidatus Levybacteria bacterium RIFCSPLOWO2_02_FULL_36_8b]|nr:MAG: hypothetical protein A3H79_00065 [Candidatus Levybacteria bacterium RIFCSPLOWO2_02_FULL_36_8b]